jgi:hypothetical protein
LPDLINHKVDGNVSETIISNLPPYSVVNLKIAVLNGRYQGDFSAPVCFLAILKFKIEKLIIILFRFQFIH